MSHPQSMLSLQDESEGRVSWRQRTINFIDTTLLKNLTVTSPSSVALSNSQTAQGNPFYALTLEENSLVVKMLDDYKLSHDEMNLFAMKLESISDTGQETILSVLKSDEALLNKKISLLSQSLHNSTDQIF